MCLPLRDSSPPKEWRSQRCGYGIITRKKLLHFKRGGARRVEGIKLQNQNQRNSSAFLKRRCHEVTEEIKLQK